MTADVEARIKQLEREQADERLRFYEEQIAKATDTLAAAQAGRAEVLKKLAELDD